MGTQLPLLSGLVSHTHYTALHYTTLHYTAWPWERRVTSWGVSCSIYKVEITAQRLQLGQMGAGGPRWLYLFLLGLYAFLKFDRRAGKAAGPRNNAVSATFHRNIKRCTFCGPFSPPAVLPPPTSQKCFSLKPAFHTCPSTQQGPLPPPDSTR